jgi:hypothetical protein
MAACVPVATTTPRRASMIRSSTATRPGATMRPSPRTNRPPLPSKRSTATRSSKPSVASSRIRGATGQMGPHRGVAGHPRDAAGFGQQIGRPDQHLRRHAAPVRALVPTPTTRPGSVLALEDAKGNTTAVRLGRVTYPGGAEGSVSCARSWYLAGRAELLGNSTLRVALDVPSNEPRAAHQAIGDARMA